MDPALVAPDLGGLLGNDPGAAQINDDYRDEQDDWEYEYSTTETETYYLTLELSYPEFKDPQQSRVPHHSRGGYYKNWLDNNPSQVKITEKSNKDERRNSNEQRRQGARNNEQAENTTQDNPQPAPAPAPAPDFDDDAPIDPRLFEKGKEVDRGEKEAEQPLPEHQGTERQGTEQRGGDDDDDGGDKLPSDDMADDIQIMELHTAKPMISYKGRVFEGSWAEVVGTEIIFADRDDQTQLPVLRHLAGDVDMLAASATRIMTTEKILRPRIPEDDPLAAIREEWNIRIPVGKDPSGERAQQTRFLENLIALKKKKGEADEVTVYARDAEGKNFKDNRDPDYKPRRRRRILNEDGEEVLPKRERPRAARRRMGRPRMRSGLDASRLVGAEASGSNASPATARGALSTATPQRWEDLTGREDDERDENPDEAMSDDSGSNVEDRDDEDESDSDDEDVTMVH